MLVEHARNVLGIVTASHAETSTDGEQVITPLSCSLDGQTIEVQLTPGTRLATLHDHVASVSEFTTCNYGLDPMRQDIASSGGMVVSGIDDTGEVRAIERVDHPFFVGTLYQPQLRTTPVAPHPIWLGFLHACSDHG